MSEYSAMASRGSGLELWRGQTAAKVNTPKMAAEECAPMTKEMFRGYGIGQIIPSEVNLRL